MTLAPWLGPQQASRRWSACCKVQPSRSNLEEIRVREVNSKLEALSDRIKAVSEKPVRCMLLGVQGLVEWEEDGWNVHPGRLEECQKHAWHSFKKWQDHTELDSVHTDQFENVDVLWLGNGDARQIFELLHEAGFDKYKLFDPFTPDEDLIPTVRYHYAARKRARYQVPGTSLMRVNLSRHRSLNGDMHRSNESIPSLDESAGIAWTGPSMVWCFQVVIFDLVEAAIDAILRRAPEHQSQLSASVLNAQTGGWSAGIPLKAELRLSTISSVDCGDEYFADHFTESGLQLPPLISIVHTEEWAKPVVIGPETQTTESSLLEMPLLKPTQADVESEQANASDVVGTLKEKWSTEDLERLQQSLGPPNGRPEEWILSRAIGRLLGLKTNSLHNLRKSKKQSWRLADNCFGVSHGGALVWSKSGNTDYRYHLPTIRKHARQLGEIYPAFDVETLTKKESAQLPHQSA